MTDILWLPGTLCDHRLFAAQREVFGEHTTAQVGQFDSGDHASPCDLATGRSA